MNEHWIEIALTTGLGILGFLMKNIWDEIKEVKARHNALEVEIARDYTSKTDLAKLETAILNRFDKFDDKLDRISEGLNQKADKE